MISRLVLIICDECYLMYWGVRIYKVIFFNKNNENIIKYVLFFVVLGNGNYID